MMSHRIPSLDTLKASCPKFNRNTSCARRYSSKVAQSRSRTGMSANSQPYNVQNQSGSQLCVESHFTSSQDSRLKLFARNIQLQILLVLTSDSIF